MTDDFLNAAADHDAQTAAEAEMAARNREEMDREGPAPTPVERPTATDGAADDREQRARHALKAPRFSSLTGDEVDLWLEKHGALQILVALAALDRKELGGTMVAHPIAYVRTILEDKTTSHRTGGARDEASFTKPGRESEREARHTRMREGYAAKFDAYKAHRASRAPEKRAAFPEYESAADYAAACMQGHELAREIATMDDSPERDALVARYRRLP